MLLLVLVLVFQLVAQSNAYYDKQRLLQKPQSILDRRKLFTNTVYDTWNKRRLVPAKAAPKAPPKDPLSLDPLMDPPGARVESGAELKPACVEYFQQLSNLYTGGAKFDTINLDKIKHFEFDKTLYQQDTWFKTAKRKLEKELRIAKQPYTAQHDEELRLNYEEQVQDLAEYELSVVQEFNHKRVFGKCFLHSQFEMNKQEDMLCNDYLERLYPWLSNKLPRFENWDKKKFEFQDMVLKKEYYSGCGLKRMNQMFSGKGIVIPILPNNKKEEQLRDINKLIRVLRVLKNRTPIQIMFMDGALTEKDKVSLVHSARSEVDKLGDSFQEYLDALSEQKGEEIKHNFSSKKHYPPQSLWFVDMSRILNRIKYPKQTQTATFNNPNFVMSLSMIFNSFEEIVVLSSQTIPLIDDFTEFLFSNHRYQETGHVFFKNPSRFKFQRRLNIPGFNEVNEFIKNYLFPNFQDEKFFNLVINSHNPDTNKIFNNRMQDILDPNVMVVNKARLLSGLLISANLQLYDILTARFEVSNEEINSDFFWLGTQMSGLTERVSFNDNYGVAVGVLTPHENKPFDILTLSHELCSASWGQVDDESEFDLIYVTSHQLDNWLDDNRFQKSLYAKYKVENKKRDTLPEDSTPEDSGVPPGDPIDINLEREKAEKERKEKEEKEKAEKEQREKEEKEKAEKEQKEKEEKEKAEREWKEKEEKEKKEKEEREKAENENNSDKSDEEIEKERKEKEQKEKEEKDRKEKEEKEQKEKEEKEKQEKEKQEKEQKEKEEAEQKEKEEAERKEKEEAEKKEKEKGLALMDNTIVYSQTVERNPLYIQSFLKPPVLFSRVHDADFREPKAAWMVKKGFGKIASYPYWCAYDIVGSPQSSNIGHTQDYNKALQAKYYFIVDTWLHFG